MTTMTTITRMTTNQRRLGCWTASLPLAGAVLGLSELLAQGPPSVPLPQLTVAISPPEAVAAGAAWRLAGEADWRPSGVAQTNISAGVYGVEYRPVPDWIVPRTDPDVINLAADDMVMLARNYHPRPEFPLEATATEGGYVRGDAWMPMGFNAISRSGAPESFRWETAVRSSGTFDFVMPRTNAGWRVQLRALPDPDYRFMGWAGDVSGARNPVTLVMNRAYAVEARFARVLGSGGAVQMAEGYSSPGTLVVHGQFNYDRGQQLRELRWRPSLPPGWRLAAVAGLAGPEISDGQIVFTGQLGHNPVLLNLTIEVPAGEAAPRELGGVVEYSFVGGAESVVRPVNTPFGTGNLVLNPRPSPAAHLAIRPVGGRPVLRLTGEVGRTYTLLHVPGFFPGYERFWWYVSDVRLTSSPQDWVDETLFGAVPSGMYRAVLLE
jgi:hypothetical protein